MASKKGPRKLITLECSECKNRNYTTEKNSRNTIEKMALDKFCKFCRKSTIHKETK